MTSLLDLCYVLCLLRPFISKYGSTLFPPEHCETFLNSVLLLLLLQLLFWTCPGLASGFKLDFVAFVAAACFRPALCPADAVF